MSSKFADTTATYSEVDVTKKKTRLAAKKDKPPEILSDVPMYSKINQVSETSAPRNADTAFDNQVYSMDTSDNTYSMLNRTVEQSHQADPATPPDNVLGTKTASHKEKLKKDQCERNLVWIMISVIILLLLAVGAVAVAALVQVSKTNSEIVSIRASLSLRLAEDSKLNDQIVSSLSDSNVMLSQNFSALEKKFEQFESRVGDLYSTHFIGRNSDNLAASCSNILLLNSSSPSGRYWIRSSNGSAVRVYCDMTRSCGGVTGGWMRVASLDMRDNSSQCPSGLRIGDSCNPERTCEIDTDPRDCSSNSYTSHGLHYSHVCGIIRAYQYRTVDAFRGSNRGMSANINSNYVDGVSLTHGVYPSRKHIWTFAGLSGTIIIKIKMGSSLFLKTHNIPPSQYVIVLWYIPITGLRNCDNTYRPSFVKKSHFFCDGFVNIDGCYTDSPLWDGADCGSNVDCCTCNDPPWFYRRLPEFTSDDIEMRVCCDQPHWDEDIAIQAFEIYVQ